MFWNFLYSYSDEPWASQGQESAKTATSEHWESQCSAIEAAAVPQYQADCSLAGGRELHHQGWDPLECRAACCGNATVTWVVVALALSQHRLSPPPQHKQQNKCRLFLSLCVRSPASQTCQSQTLWWPQNLALSWLKVWVTWPRLPGRVVCRVPVAWESFGKPCCTRFMKSWKRWWVGELQDLSTLQIFFFLQARFDMCRQKCSWMCWRPVGWFCAV